MSLFSGLVESLVKYAADEFRESRGSVKGLAESAHGLIIEAAAQNMDSDVNS